MPAYSPKPQTETDADLQTLPKAENDKTRMVDVAKLFSREAYDVLIRAGKLAFSLKDFYLTPLHVFYVFLDDPFTKNLNLGNLSEIKKTVFEKIKALPQPKFSSLVFLEPKLKESLISSYVIAKRNNFTKVEKQQFLLGILNSEMISDINKQFGIDPLKFEQNSKKTISMGSYVSQNSPFISDLASSFAENADFKLIGRENELNQLIRVFGRQSKNNALIVGEDGVGKDALVFGLVSKIKKQELPEAILNIKVIKIDLQSLLSNPDNFNKFAPQVLENVENMGRAIIFLNEIEFLTTLQQKQMLLGFTQMVIKNTKSQIILSTKTNFYHENLQTSPVINEFFEVVRLDEMTSEETLSVLRQEALKIEKFHNVKIDEKTFGVTIDLSKRYLTRSYFPQKAISLLEEAAALTSLKKEQVVTPEIVKQVVADKTGVPVQELSVSERERLINLQDEFKKFIIGQDSAVFVISEAIKRARAGLRDPRKPIGSFLFLGPTGVGKTETARVLAKLFFSNEKAFVRLDMSEFSEAHTVQRLLGSPPSYVGYEEGGQLTNPVLERPYSLILLDEIEKANPKVFDIFLQVLDDGRLTDSQGRTADFKNTILIFTSNIGSDEILEKIQAGGGARDSSPANISREDLIDILRDYFRPEFINRFDDIVIFNALGISELVQIAKLKIKRIQESLKEKGIGLEISDERLEQMVKAAYDPAFGARPIERMLREQVENKIAHSIIAGELNEGDVVRIN